jgi:RNA polymerase sigma factor (sigma-70 family)
VEAGKNRIVLRQVETLFSAGAIGGLSDGQLLERFIRGRRDSADLAFGALVERHGPMVLRVCQAVLRDPHDAEDAFQATFLVLVRKASAVRRRDSIASWLYGVALRVASCARRTVTRRREHERRWAKQAPASWAEDRPHDEVASIVHAAIGDLPERYRSVIILCHLQGVGCEEAAHELGWPVGTVKSRLSRGRERLQARLSRRGVAPALAAACAASVVSTPVSASLIGSTVRAAWSLANASPAVGETLSFPVISYMKGALRSMFLTKLKFATGALLMLGVVSTGTLAIARAPKDDAGPQANDPAALQRQMARLDDLTRILREQLRSVEAQLEETKRALARIENSQRVSNKGEVSLPTTTDNATVRGAEPRPANADGRLNSFEIAKGLYFVTSASRDKVAVVSANSKKGLTLSLPKNSDSPLSVVPVIGGFNPRTGMQGMPAFVALQLSGKNISRIAVCDLAGQKWYPMDLRVPSSGDVSPVVGQSTVLYQLGHTIYAFSAVAKRWGVLEVPDGVAMTPVVTNGNDITVKYDDHIYSFDVRSGEFKHTDLGAILREALDNDKPDDPNKK